MQIAWNLLFSLIWPVRLYRIFPLSHKRRDFRKKVIEQKMCVLIFSIIVLKHFSLLEELSEILSLICISFSLLEELSEILSLICISFQVSVRYS